MPVSDDVVERAKRGDLASCETMLAASYPSVLRMARALTGNPESAEEVCDFVLTRGMRVMPSWRRGSMPENWFYHHTLLAARDRAASAPIPEPLADPLINHFASAPESSDPAYVAFVRAVRSLPPQQREAFILHHGERLNSRLLGVAMDCSAGAAENHLAAATAALSAVAGQWLAAYATTMSRAYVALAPAEAEVGPKVRDYARRYVAPLRLRRLLRRLVLLVVLVTLIGVGWHWRHEWVGWVSRWIERIRDGR